MSFSGVGKTYAGDQGKAYATWQNNWHRGLGTVVARKFNASIRATDSVVDFGCGDGENLSSIACAKKIGIEPNDAAADFARSRGLEVHPTLSAIPDGSVDVVMTHHALEHCLRPIDELIDMLRVLKQDGRLIVVVPIDDWRSQRRYDPADIHRHLVTWTPQLLGNSLNEAGYRVTSIGISHYTWPPKAHWSARTLPPKVFDTIAGLWSHFTRIREIRAVAVRA